MKKAYPLWKRMGLLFMSFYLYFALFITAIYFSNNTGDPFAVLIWFIPTFPWILILFSGVLDWMNEDLFIFLAIAVNATIFFTIGALVGKILERKTSKPQKSVKGIIRIIAGIFLILAILITAYHIIGRKHDRVQVPGRLTVEEAQGVDCLQKYEERQLKYDLGELKNPRCELRMYTRNPKLEKLQYVCGCSRTLNSVDSNERCSFC